MSLEQDVRILSQVPIFSQLEGEALRLLAFTAEKIQCLKDEALFRSGEPSDCAYLLISGKVRLENAPGDPMASTIAEANFLIGETALVADTRRPCTATAIEDCHAFRIPRPLFLRIMREFPGGAVKVRAFMASRLREFVSEIDAARCRADSLAAQ